MLNNTQGFEHSITISETKILFGMNWQSNEFKHPILAKFSLKKSAKESDLHYCVSRVVENGDSGKKSSFQTAFIHEVENKDQRIISSADLIASSIFKWAKVEKNTAPIFIKEIEGESVSSPSRFWVTAVLPDGRVSTEFDTIVEDRYALASIIEDIQLTESTAFVTVESDKLVHDILNNMFKGGISAVQESEQHIISVQAFNVAIKNHDNTLKRVYKPSKIQVKKFGLIAGGVTCASLLFFGYSYWSQMNAFNVLNDVQVEQEVTGVNNDLSRKLKGFKGGASWTPEIYRNETLESFIDGMRDSIYTPLNVAIIIREINRSLPKYSSGWILEKVTFIDNQFVVHYVRRPSGKGVYFFLDEDIAAYSASSKGLDIKPKQLLDHGSVRVYSVTPNLQLESQFKSQELLSGLRDEAKLKSQYKRAVKLTNDKAKAVVNIFTQYHALTFAEKWFDMQAEDLSTKLALAINNLKAAKEKSDDLSAKVDSLERIELDNSLIIGNVMDFITMMQLDSVFNWPLPVLVNTYPDQEVLNSKNASAMKNIKMMTAKMKRSKDGDSEKYRKRILSYKENIFGPAIETYSVKISTQSSEEEGKIKSYGISDMIQLGVLLNKPFIQVDSVEYMKKTDQWTFIITFNRKTPEYKRYIEEFDNKDV